jgi:uncharacterized protein DUF4124
MNGRVVMFLATTMLAFGASAQTYYKWTDAKGVTHYSAQRPPAVKVQPLHLRNEVSAPATAATAPSAPAATADALRAAQNDFAKQTCATARANLRLLSSNAMVLDTGTMQHPEDVTTATMLSAEQRTAATAKAQRQIDQYCERG